jgi:peptidoglycan/xylan/chitin deacetylase (PgdA/CDA1 family)
MWCLFLSSLANPAPAAPRGDSYSPYHAIAIRTTENVTEGGWVWILEQAARAGIDRIDVLVKQDEDNYASHRTGRVLQSGELLVALPGETTAEGWENSDWLIEMLARADELGIEIWAWFPVFHDAATAAAFPAARYTAGDGSVFVDAAVPGVGERQIELLRKVLDTYDFDGVSLDWVRYDNWADGMDGPLADVFHARTGEAFGPEMLERPLAQAIWGEIREEVVAGWVASMVAEVGAAHPDVAWGGYLLPPQFNEVSQDYRALAAAGLEYIQPMLYWSLWGFSPEWAGVAVERSPFWARPDTRLVPTLDLNRPDGEHMRSVAAMGEDRMFGYLWYHDTGWTEAHFTKVRRLAARLREARASRDPDWIRLPASPDEGPQPARFPADTSAWSLVLLAEIYDQGLLQGSDPPVPVLTLHRFLDAPLGHDGAAWANSAAYIEELFGFLETRDFTVIPLSHLRARMLGGHYEALPERPIVLTVDDGAASVLEHFHPIAAARGIPYALSVITDGSADEPLYLDEAGRDPQMAWDEVRRLADTGLVELVSHSHALHRYVSERPEGGPLVAAVLARRWLPESGRQETPAERLVRVQADLARSRAEIEARTDLRTTVLAWPYGNFDEAAERVARDVGFTHFLTFGGSRYALPAWAPRRIGRVPISRNDERVPLALPDDPQTLQGWWLAFLTFGRQTASAGLIEAALVQLDDTAARHWQAVLSRAALDALSGRPSQAARRLDRLRRAYPDSDDVAWAIYTFQATYRAVL